MSSLDAGIDPGGTSVNAAADARGHILASDSFPTEFHEGPESVVKRVAAANGLTILHPDLIVLGAGVAEMGDLLAPTVRDQIRQRVRMFPTDKLRVERTRLGDRAGVMGAAGPAFDASG